jgi:hypothetical protein
MLGDFSRPSASARARRVTQNQARWERFCGAPDDPDGASARRATAALWRASSLAFPVTVQRLNADHCVMSGYNLSCPSARRSP